MTPQDLIAAFEKVAEAPEGVQRLRELVVQLAVRGRLVAQEPEDEPASVMLERIAEEKARLVKERKIKKPKLFPMLSGPDIAFDLPSRDWAAGVSKPTLNLYLYDIRECHDLKNPSPWVTRPGPNNTAIKSRPDVRVDLTYNAVQKLVTMLRQSDGPNIHATAWPASSRSRVPSGRALRIHRMCWSMKLVSSSVRSTICIWDSFSACSRLK